MLLGFLTQQIDMNLTFHYFKATLVDVLVTVSAVVL